ncbi:MerR family transcriptional regulator [Eubacterium sp. 1001713B170207_170306_E7]|uniref:MerR family transcriptional regulator n=1 Tax=Eubacterium sp. 1001713B170207_170306_E7 TaxID=2787097 RepID=UPI0018999074|nr:MerR family transcriptional regulator [Eubacterium sp. 1001713B170207_170306_E7]
MFTIGEFSKLGRVSPRMLRYYDAMGLLRPSSIGENGYRYYEAAQLETLSQIETLKSYGFALSEIGSLLELPEHELAARLHRRRLDAYDEIYALRKKLRHMEDAMMKMEKSDLLKDQYHVIVMETPAQRVYGIRRKINISETGDLFDELYRKVDALGLKRCGAAQQVYLGEEFNYESMDIEAQVEVSGEDPDIKVIPARLCVATTHTGPFEGLHNAYDAICSWLAEHPEYKVTGPSVERYLKDVDAVKSEEELETGILFPVEKVQ